MTRGSKVFITASKAGISLLAFILFSHVTYALQTPRISDEQFARIVSRVSTELDASRERAKLPGASVAFVLSDGHFASLSSGVADRERNVPLKPSDRMLAGSIGKTFVAAMALLLVRDHKLDLDDRIDRWLSGEKWFSRLPNANEIT